MFSPLLMGRWRPSRDSDGNAVNGRSVGVVSLFSFSRSRDLLESMILLFGGRKLLSRNLVEGAREKRRVMEVFSPSL